MDQDVFEWLLLLGRWLHITVAMAWIGTSIFFMWLDRSFEVNPKATREGHVGELWMVHGGGFYHVEKLLMGPTKVPEHLHWFKWESYWTWMSGFFLALMIFYTGNGTFLLDSSVSGVTYWQAVGIGLSAIAVSWIFYDVLWELKLTKNSPLVGHVLTLLWLAGISYFLCQTLSGRAAYIHIGGMLGTWMTGNVFLRIIPRQIKMVEACKKGEAVNQDWGKNAKNRSTHNTYFTLPVIFIMLSNHFPSTYGHSLNWLILLLITTAGAAIRHYFVIRLVNPTRAKVFALIGFVIIAGVVASTRQRTAAREAPVAAVASVVEGPTVNVAGVVRFAGPPPAPKKLPMPFGCTDTFSNEVIVNSGKLKNALVRITRGLEGRVYTDVPEAAVLLDQRNCIYEPRVIGVRVGQKVEFINSDDTFHNVKSVTKNNEEFNVAMPKKDDRITKIFNRPEVFLQTKCSVHPWMGAYIAVVEHPFFSVTNDSGEFALKNLPVGSYTIEVWHEVFGTQVQELIVKEGESPVLEFSFQKDGK